MAENKEKSSATAEQTPKKRGFKQLFQSRKMRHGSLAVVFTAIAVAVVILLGAFIAARQKARKIALVDLQERAPGRRYDKAEEKNEGYLRKVKKKINFGEEKSITQIVKDKKENNIFYNM